MATLWGKETGEFESSAKVVDGNLIISLPDAINPIVWRMELGSVKASALEVRAQGENGPHMLTLKTPKGESHDIAPYETRQAAVTALMRVSAALQAAEGRIAPTSTTGPLPPGPMQNPPVSTVFVKPDAGTVKWLLVLGGVLLAIFMFAYMAKLSAPVQTASTPGMESATSTGTGSPGSESGVAQSADDVLGGGF